LFDIKPQCNLGVEKLVIVFEREEGAETGKKSEKKWNHEPGFITQGTIPTPDLTD
jgi:hypothetical protein